MLVALQVLFILLLLGAGWAARRFGLLTRIGTSELAKVLLGIVYPALILHSITRKSWPDLISNWPLPALNILLALVGLGVGLLTLRLVKRMPDQTARGFLFHSMINNSLFLPLPIIVFLFGEDGVSLLILSTVGFELVLWTLGVFVLAPGTTPLQRLRMSLGPPPIALILAFSIVLVRDLHLVPWPALDSPSLARHLLNMGGFMVDTLGKGTVPISFLVAGSRMADLHPHFIRDSRIWLVSAIRLLIVPAMMLGLLSLLPISPLARGVMTVVSVMPSAIASIAFSERFGGDSDFIAAVLLLTHIGALITVPVFLALAL